MTAKSVTEDPYAVSEAAPDAASDAPTLAYRPPRPRRYRPRIGLIGAGGITKQHLAAYRQAGYDVVAITDLDAARAEDRRKEFYPAAQVMDSAAALLARPDIDVVDLAPHPAERAPLLMDAIAAGKHVLSQKPFVLDLDFGERVVDTAHRQRVRLAVNQNGRWAPHVCWMRRAIEAGLIGDVVSVDAAIHWNHNWVKGKPFDRIPHLVLYDFAIHWFDMVHCYLRPAAARTVTATTGTSRTQEARPPLLAQVNITFDHAQASLQFRADTRFGSCDRTVIVGSRGTLVSTGPNLNDQTVTLTTAAGQVTPPLQGAWFPDGFDGAMSELLCAIEDDRDPDNSGADNLHPLAMCFAAIASAEHGGQVTPVGQTRRIEPQWLLYPD